MLDKVKLENILFLDVETAAVEHEYNSLPERQKNLWARKTSWLAEKEGKSPEELYEKAGIWAEFGKIICISVGILKSKSNYSVLRLKSFYGHNEKQLLENFAFLLNNHYFKDKHFLCAHNGKEFDFPYIARRMLINEIKIPRILSTMGNKPWETKHFDTMELWKFGDRKHYTSLDLLASLFNIPSPKNDIDGGMVNKIYWEEGDLQKIADYCQKDVITISKVFLKLREIHDITNFHIEISDPTITN